MTGTYKLIKRDLQKEGFNFDVIGPEEEIYFMGPNDKDYKKLDRNLYQDIQKNIMAAKL